MPPQETRILRKHADEEYKHFPTRKCSRCWGKRQISLLHNNKYRLTIFFSFFRSSPLVNCWVIRHTPFYQVRIRFPLKLFNLYNFVLKNKILNLFLRQFRTKLHFRIYNNLSVNYHEFLPTPFNHLRDQYQFVIFGTGSLIPPDLLFPLEV